MKVAKVKLSWKPSVSTDVKFQTVVVAIDNIETLRSVVDPSVAEVLIDVAASKSVVFSVLTTDFEDQEVTSEIYTFTIGDLEAPQPATDLFHEIVAVVDLPDDPPPVDPSV